MAQVLQLLRSLFQDFLAHRIRKQQLTSLVPPLLEDIKRPIENHFDSRKDRFHIALMLQAPHGRIRRANEAGSHSLDETPLVSRRPTHSSQFCQLQNDFPGRLFKGSNQQRFKRCHNHGTPSSWLVIGGRHYLRI
jgi:hypothetical protein